MHLNQLAGVVRRLAWPAIRLPRPIPDPSAAPEEPPLNTIAALLQPRDILPDLAVSDKDHLLLDIGRHMEREHGLPAAWVSNSLARREQAGSTGLGQGFAIPHARVKELERIQVAYLRLESPIAFDAPDSLPVSDVLVLLVPKQATEVHLKILSEATQMFSDPAFRQRLQQCQGSGEIKRAFDTWSIPS